MRVNDRHISFYYENDHDYGPIEIDKKKTALLVIDMQHVFITRPKIDNPTQEDKANAQRWEQFYKKIDEEVVPNNQKLLEAFRKNKMEVVFAKIQTYSLKNMSEFKTSSLVTRLTNDINFLQRAVLMSLRLLVRAPVFLVSTVVLTYLTSHW